uniref:Phosphatase PP2A regulatory subunit A/Splicing factor 3B subunit 1-like HEAT repeat domain-containing protein n=1 Tax=Chromera velia CCMP2878 TaxID=1169474 RepID=A0A0G4H473_9ALVE|eukprot:Cvel_5674.t1-p1 / transcript=Cvel_5674.t1 / gene=Cvel_5674 / organism=Chromera_velia_CCMP2878 / gene_product=Serine/threonine-protein phosphatase 2A 65 kDa, putative / transcript_product=Serine/threonine-protein phosphatase 2A 65 kDa, putative / location=Cvel_scaffold268:2810-6421(+) / protein_length=666 / sequence_SO=supercontig / SO=protein_coding / is_pseudo=false
MQPNHYENQNGPVNVLIEELRHEDTQARLNAIRQLGTICVALGPERTCEELVPFLSELIDDDDEILIAVSEQLGNLVEAVGGPEHAHVLLAPLEELANVEEAMVRSQASRSFCTLIESMPPSHIAQHVYQLVNRLAMNDWFTSRSSASGLIASAIRRAAGDEVVQGDFVRVFKRLCSDDTPMVRKSAGENLSAVAEAVSPTLLEEVVEEFNKLLGDTQDTVRQTMVGNIESLGKLLPKDRVQDVVVSAAETLARDASWRVRYLVSDSLESISRAMEASMPNHGEIMLELVCTVMEDAEAEVRTGAATNLAKAASVLPKTEEVVSRLQPLVDALSQDPIVHVRAAVAEKILELAAVWGAETAVSSLMSVILRLMRDDSPDVRLKLLERLAEFGELFNLEHISQALLPCVRELAKDPMWRVRLSILRQSPALATLLGRESFDGVLKKQVADWLKDPVFAVREDAALNFAEVTKNVGAKWGLSLFETTVKTGAATSSNYLHRVAALFTAAHVGTLTEAAGSSPSDLAALRKEALDLAAHMAGDRVANVRLNVVKCVEKVFLVASPSRRGAGESGGAGEGGRENGAGGAANGLKTASAPGSDRFGSFQQPPQEQWRVRKGREKEAGEVAMPILESLCKDPDRDVSNFATASLERFKSALALTSNPPLPSD